MRASLSILGCRLSLVLRGAWPIAGTLDMAIISRYSLGFNNVPGAVSGPRSHPGRGKPEDFWGGESRNELASWRGFLEKVTWAGAGRIKPSFASPPLPHDTPPPATPGLSGS